MPIRDEFKQPSASYRGKPLWVWQGTLLEDELRQQLRAFAEMGLGGACIHGRSGLRTPYLGPEWLRLVRVMGQTAAELGLELWLADEERWPSGSAGGQVTADPALRQHTLSLKICDPENFKASKRELAVFLAAVGGDQAANVRPLRDDVTIGHGDQVLAFSSHTVECSPWYNGQTYLDTLSPAAGQRFIALTHERYAQAVLAHLPASVITAFCTDEPHYGLTRHGKDGAASLPWTPRLPEIFQERYGYDLLTVLPELFFVVEGEAWSAVRRDFRDCLTWCFTEALMRPLADWCAAHGRELSGHLPHGATLRAQTAWVGSAMRAAEPMQVPGVAIMMAQGLQRAGSRPPEYLTLKQVASVQRQLGRRWLMSELYGCTGWHLTLAEHKAVGDWQAALGVNRRCLHLAWTTLLGTAKRDYPASLSPLSPWWRDYPLVEDYFARLNVMLSQGEAVREVAVLHPIESAWGYFTGNPSPGLDELEQALTQMVHWLLEEHYDFDFVDEDLLARLGSCQGNRLKVGQAEYRVLLVPPLVTLRQSTVTRLRAWQAGGGRVFFVQAVPARVNGQLSDEAQSLPEAARPIPLSRPALLRGLATVRGLRRAVIQLANGEVASQVLAQWRVGHGQLASVLFLCNTHQQAATGPLTISLPGTGQVQEWDPHTGAVSHLPATDALVGDGPGVRFQTALPAAGSRLFVVQPLADALLPTPVPLTERRRQPLSVTECPIRLDEPNAMPLDYASFSLEGGPWEEFMDILRADALVRALVGLPPRGGQAVQPWAAGPPRRAVSSPISLRFRFTCEQVPTTPCHLVLEAASLWTAKLNGVALTTPPEGCWLDPCLSRLPLPPAALKLGVNEVILEGHYTHDHPGLEACYLIGDFGLRWQALAPVIQAPVRRLPLGDYTAHGLLCYTGTVTYCLSFSADLAPGERLFIELPAWQASVVRVRVNGQVAGRLAWQPWELDITDLIRPAGEQTLEVDIVGSRRNLLGPLHNTDLYPEWTSPAEFTLRDDRWTDDLVRLPYGLLAPPVLSFRSP